MAAVYVMSMYACPGSVVTTLLRPAPYVVLPELESAVSPLAVLTSADPPGGAGSVTVEVGAVLAAVGDTGGAATEKVTG